MFGSNNVKTITYHLADPGADNKQYHVFRAPKALEFIRGYIICRDAQGAGSAGAFEWQNWGTAGTSVAGTVFTSAGGTASGSRLSAETPSALTVSEGTMAEGEWLVLDYQETGDWVENTVSFTLDYVLGVGAT